MSHRLGLDVVVVNYQTPRDLNLFAESLYDNLPDLPVTLFFVSNSPKKEDLEVVEKWMDRPEIEAHHIVNHDNVGYGKAFNQAFAQGDRRVTVAFNADVILEPGALDRCYDALMGNKDWAVLGPRQVDLTGKLTHGGIFGTLAAPQHRGWKKYDKAEYGDIREAVTVSGSAYFLKRDVGEMLIACSGFGPFLETPHYFEETTCSYHCQAHGYKVFYYGPVKIIHKWMGATKDNAWATQKFRESQKMFRAFCDDHGIPHD